jgi:glyoxylase-like metal-dependent hydrolase (beta-lactamase superfamily II)
MLVDGGFSDTCEKIVEHIHEQFEHGAVLERVLLSHPGLDHASGLRTVLEEQT